MKFFSRSFNILANHILRSCIVYSLHFLAVSAILTFPSDQNDYKRIVLKNNLEVMQIINSGLNQSYCAISINVGDIDNTVPGIAHLIEHLLFMGTNKFPEENAFDLFIKTNNGFSNAYTTFDITNFHFNIDSENFVKALEMLLCFFYQPLFTEEAINSAINAVDKEFSIATVNDYRKLHRLFQTCIKETYNNFGNGNHKTLNVKNIREKVIKFFREKYDSCKMKLVIFHNEDIEDKIKEFFELIPQISKTDKAKAQNNIIGNFVPDLFKKEFTNKYIFYETIKDTNEMSIYIEIPNILKTFKSKSIDYIKYLITKNDKSSLDYELKAKNLAFDVDFTIAKLTKISYCKIGIQLTEKGSKKYEDVVDILYSYLCKLNISYDTFKKFLKLNQNKFRDLENEESLDSLIELSNILHNVPFEFSIYYPYICEYYNKNEFKYLLDILKNPENWLVFISDKNRFINNSAFKTEEYFKIKYFISNQIKINNRTPSLNNLQINLSKNKNIKNITIDLKDYSINKVVGQYNKKNKLKIKKQKMDVISLKKIAKIFQKNDNDGKFICFNDNAYQSNTDYISIFFNFEMKKEDFVKIFIYLKIMHEKYTRELRDYFEMNNVSVNPTINSEGIRFIFSGSSEVTLKCIRKYIKLFKTPKIENFLRIKNELIDSYKNYKFNNAFNVVSSFLNEKIYNNWPYDKELLQFCCDINENDIKLNHEYFIEIFAVSNNNSKLLEFYEELKKQFKTRNRYKFKGVLPKLHHKIYTNIENNNCVGIFISYDTISTYKALAGIQIISSHFSQKFFYKLRTKDQIGYIADSCRQLVNKKIFFNL